ncbi:MAG: EAL domain-containing protein [Burkholderiales bacterium]|nr:EAL domain-containing protein [Burkholderiales bacterium]
MAPENPSTPKTARATAPVLPFWYSSHIWLAPLITAFFILLVVLVTQQQVKEQDLRIRTDATQELSTLAAKYAERTKLLLYLADQFLLTAKWEAEQHPATVDLERLQMHILLPAASHMRISLSDSKGILRQSTSPFWTPLDATDISQRPFFKALAKDPDAGLYFHKVEDSKVTAQPALLLVRRINRPDRSFGGVVIVGADLDVFLTFLDSDELLPGSFIGLLGPDGTYYAFRSATPELKSQMEHPLSNLPATGSGVLLLETGPGDPLSRTVAWNRIPGYDITAIVSQTAASQAERHMGTTVRYYKQGLTISLLILLIGGGWFVAAYRARARHLKQASSVNAYRMAAEGSNDAFLVQRPMYDVAGEVIDFIVTDCNKRAEVMHGLQPGRLIGLKLSELAPGESLVALYAQIMKSGVPCLMNDVEVQPHAMMTARWITRRLIPFEEGISVTIQDITASKEQARALVDMAFTDALTGLPNRRWLTENLPQVLERCRAKSEQTALLFIDLDNFKTVNDTLGHEVGDALLMETASRVRSAIREHDVLCRLGGDELTVILESSSSIDEVTRVCERILAKLSSPLIVGGTGQETVVGASIGISLYPDDGEEAGGLIKCADLAMYNAKEAGKGTFRFYSAHLSARAQRRVGVEQALRQAVSRDEFFLAYQPKVSLGRQSAVIGSEALLRWNHPQNGLVMPDDFIGLAEETGLIDAIGQHVLHLACKQLSAWREAGIPLLPVSINVSPHQFVSGDIVEAIRDALVLYNLPGSLLEIEVTEQSMLGHPEQVRRLLRPLKAMGVRVAVDDFGTGYSNLAQLDQLDVDVLKIDRSFVTQVPQNAGVGSVVAAVIHMAKAMRMTVVAEGVETAEQLAFLVELDCHAVQGYYYSKPVMADVWCETVAGIERRITGGTNLVPFPTNRRVAHGHEEP